MCRLAPSKSGRPVRSVNIGWHHVAWRPHIIAGAPVSDPACGRPVLGWSRDICKRDDRRVVCVGREAGIPWTEPGGAVLPPARRNIQFPTL